MAKTAKGIYYPSDYESVADVPSDLKEMAESIEQAFENEAYDDTEIKQEQITQNENIKQNTDNIELLNNSIGDINTILDQINGEVV